MKVKVEVEVEVRVAEGPELRNQILQEGTETEAEVHHG